MSIRHVSIFLPRENSFYRGLLRQIRRGFESLGITTSGAMRHLTEQELVTWCTEHHTDVVFEMNRPRCEVSSLPRDVAHVCWVVDLNGRPLHHFQGSEATYLFSDVWPRHYPHKGFFRWMGPGTCEMDYAWAEHRHEVDASFVGHMPNPWTDEELSRDVTGHNACTFGEILPHFEELLRQHRDNLYSTPDFMEKLDQACISMSGYSLDLDDRLRYDITCRIIRHINRCELADAALASGSSLALFGPPSWANWPQYAPHYRGWLDSPEELRKAYATARVNLHEGTGIHFRSMDVMSSGGLLFWRETASDHWPGGIASQFEPHVHYVPFRLENLRERLHQYAQNTEQAHRVRTAAAQAIRSGHTWRHRAADIIHDLEQL